MNVIELEPGLYYVGTKKRTIHKTTKPEKARGFEMLFNANQAARRLRERYPALTIKEAL